MKATEKYKQLESERVALLAQTRKINAKTRSIRQQQQELLSRKDRVIGERIRKLLGYQTPEEIDEFVSSLTSKDFSKVFMSGLSQAMSEFQLQEGKKAQ
jgi:hypothetical protein